jgi:DNA-binding response OmpR family regulator
MVVEDDVNVQILIKNTLKQDYDVHTCGDGLEGLRALESGVQPDLLITDVMMPSVDGLTMIQTMRKVERLRSIPVIILSSRTSPQDVVSGINAGAKYYVTKPFKLDDLLAKVRRAIGR